MPGTPDLLAECVAEWAREFGYGARVSDEYFSGEVAAPILIDHGVYTMIIWRDDCCVLGYRSPSNRFRAWRIDLRDPGAYEKLREVLAAEWPIHIKELEESSDTV